LFESILNNDCDTITNGYVALIIILLRTN